MADRNAVRVAILTLRTARADRRTARLAMLEALAAFRAAREAADDPTADDGSALAQADLEISAAVAERNYVQALQAFEAADALVAQRFAEAKALAAVP